MTVPNFFKYDVYLNGFFIGSAVAPCKWALRKVFRGEGIKIKWRGFNI